GNCLTFAELQGVLDSEKVDLYAGGDCDQNYKLDGKINQKLVCGLELETGEWNRKMVQHKKAGVYWFSTPPCEESVEFSNYFNTTYEEVPSTNVCTKENSKVKKYQQEKLTATSFDVADGQAYLPNPYWVHQEKLGTNERGDYARLSCLESELNADYLGWGAFHAKWTEAECDTHKMTNCKDAKLSASKNDKDETCALVEKLTDCMPAPTPTPKP
ncbi:MAG: hypothetical protein JWQ35_822, partial [Bacteriovoracaceae bacterium]|nr:hypothetical protein [Bacteriovoracaceae bacterium]